MWGILLKSVSCAVVSGAITADIEHELGYVGGNSIVQADKFEEGSINQMRSQHPYFDMVFKVKDVADGAIMTISGYDIWSVDGIAFGLIQKAGMTGTSTDRDLLEDIMEDTYSFIMSLNYFTDPLPHNIFRGETLHRIDYNLSQSKNPEKEIKKYYNAARQYYSSIGYGYDEAVGAANVVKGELEKYQERREIVFDAYAEYIYDCIN